MESAFFKTIDRRFGFRFRGNPLDRASARREEAAYVEGLRRHPDARTALFARDMPILGAGDPRQALFPLDVAQDLGGATLEIWLGLEPSGAPVFAALLPETAVEERADLSDGFLDRRDLVVPGRPDLNPIDLRSIAVQGLVDPETVAILGQAKAVAHWHVSHGFCAKCGARSRSTAAGWRRECDACHTQHFPRTDPVVIMLVADGDRCLLGRQARFPKGMYSTLAGFVEPGETIEEAVRREIAEESGIVCGAVGYVASQPWPFPASLMIGCVAEALTREIVVDKQELEDARWFERDEVRSMFDKTHPLGVSAPHPMAIAHHLLKFWLDGGAP